MFDDGQITEGDDRTHVWIVAANIRVADRLASRAWRTGRFDVPERTRVEALEVSCAVCRLSYEKASDDPCRPTEWLRGGPSGRKRRKKGQPGTTVGGELNGGVRLPSAP